MTIRQREILINKLEDLHDKPMDYLTVYKTIPEVLYITPLTRYVKWFNWSHLYTVIKDRKHIRPTNRIYETKMSKN